MLKYLCKHYGLPNLDLFYIQQDGLHGALPGPIPIFTGARVKGVTNSILFIDWYYDISLYRDWNLSIDAIDNALYLHPWNSRIEKVFWRGSPTDMWSGGCYSPENWHLHARGKACWLSQKHPHLIDASFTNIHSFLVCNGNDLALRRILPQSVHVSIEDHLDYKYQLQITGLMANFPRDRWQFYSNSVVFRHECPHEMFWYGLIKPWEHYIPIASDLSDLLEKIDWAKTHDEECRQIAARARQFIEEHVMPEHIALYCYKALLKYASLFKD